MNKNILYILIFFIGELSFGQTELKNNSAYVEFLGNGGSFVSVNYERLVHYKKDGIIHSTFRFGFSFSSNRWDKTSIYNIPLELNTLIGKQKQFAEIGFGWTAFLGTSNLNDTLTPVGYRTNFWDTYFIRLGYRYMGDKFLFRIAPLAGFTGVTPQSKKRELIWGFGISFGGCFNFRKTKNINDAYGD